GPFGFVEGVEERVGLKLAEGLEELVGEGPADHGGGGEGAPPVLAEMFKAAAQNEAQALGHVELTDGDLGAEAAVGTEEPALLDQVLEHLFEEVRVAIRLSVEGVDQRLIRIYTAQAQIHY